MYRYGAELSKVHKQGAPLRLIISLTKTPTYKLASYLYNGYKNSDNSILQLISLNFYSSIVVSNLHGKLKEPL